MTQSLYYYATVQSILTMFKHITFVDEESPSFKTSYLEEFL